MQKTPLFDSCKVLALLLFSVALFTGCDDSSSSSDGPVFSSAKPDGWTRKENYPVATGVSANYVDFAPRAYNFSANAIVVTARSAGQSPASAVTEGVTQLQANPAITNFTIDSSSAATVGGKEGYRVQFRYSQSVNGTWLSLLQRQLLVVHKGMDCQLILTRLQSDSLDGAAAFRAIEASIKLD